MKFKIVESFSKLSQNCFFTDYEGDILNLCKNKQKDYRILYDSNIDKWFIGDANSVLHYDMINYAYNSGLYYSMEDFIDSIGSIENYIEYGLGGQFIETENGEEEVDQYLYYIYFASNSSDFSLYDDDYDKEYPCDFGRFYTRDCDIKETPLYNKIKNCIKKLQNESYNITQVKNKFFKYTYNAYKKNNGEEYAKDMATKLTNNFDDKDFEYVADWLNSMTFPLTIYRGYRINDISKKVYGDGVNLDNPGRHWTTDPQMFFNRGTIGNSKMNYITVGEVDKNDVDWDSTIDTFMYYSLPGKTQYGAYPENEIYLRKSAKPKNMKVYHRDDFLKKFYDSLNEKLLSAKLKKYDGADGKKKYIHDFMRSDEAIEEFPDVKQRYAVCISYWNNRNKVL